MPELVNPREVTNVAREYLATRQKLQAKHFKANTGAAPLVIPLRVKVGLQEQFCRHPRFRSTDLVDLNYLARIYLKGAKSFPLTDRATCIAVLLSALAYGQMPTKRTTAPDEGRRFRV